jgi:hypothetical protein
MKPKVLWSAWYMLPPTILWSACMAWFWFGDQDSTRTAVAYVNSVIALMWALGALLKISCDQNW